jgi:hypothetical protein
MIMTGPFSEEGWEENFECAIMDAKIGDMTWMQKWEFVLIL